MIVAPDNANTEFAGYRHNVVLIYDSGDSVPKFSPKAPVCLLGSDVTGGATEIAYLLERGRPACEFVYAARW